MAYQIRQFYEMSGHDLTRLYQEAERDGVFEWVGHDCLMTGDHFNLVARQAEVFAGVYDEGGNPSAFFFLTDFEGMSAHIHFGVLRRGRPRRRAIGRTVLAWCFETFAFHSLVGVAPEINRPARLYALELGGRRLGAVPGLCWMARPKKCVDGIIFVFERKE